MTQRESSDSGLLGSIDISRIRHHRHRGGYSLVAGAAVAHDGHEGATHAGVAGSGSKGDGVRHGSVAEKLLAEVKHCRPERMTVVPLEGEFGSGEIQLLASSMKDISSSGAVVAKSYTIRRLSSMS